MHDRDSTVGGAQLVHGIGTDLAAQPVERREHALASESLQQVVEEAQHHGAGNAGPSMDHRRLEHARFREVVFGEG